MKRHYIDSLYDIIEYATNAIEFVKDMSYDEYLNDIKTKYAVFRALEIIGEASKNIPTNIKKENPDIEWKKIAGMRNKLIHEYIGIDYEIAWDTVKSNLPTLTPQILKMIENYKMENPDLFSS